MIRNNIVTYAAILGGLFLAAAGLLGFLTHGLHLNGVINLAHLTSGALALYFGLKSTSVETARTFCQAIGFVYALVGLLGFVNAFGMGSGGDARQIAEHAAHLALGVGFVTAAMVQPMRPANSLLGVAGVKGRSV